MKITIYTSESGIRSENVEHSDAASHIAAGGSYSAESAVLLAFIAAEEVPSVIAYREGDKWNQIETGVRGNEDFFVYESQANIEITTHTNKNGETYFSKGEGEEAIYSFTRDFEDIWTQEDEDLERRPIFLAELNDGGKSESFGSQEEALAFIAQNYLTDSNDLGIWEDEDGRTLVWMTQDDADAAEDGSNVIATIKSSH